MNRELLQQALQHLVDLADDLRRIPSDIAQTIAALEAELAKPESHIVKWSIPVDPNNFGEPLAQPEPQVCCGDYEKCIKACTPRGRWLAEQELAKPWQGLTDDEIKEVLDLNVAPWSLSGVALQHVMDDARALEAKLKEKNNAV